MELSDIRPGLYWCNLGTSEDEWTHVVVVVGIYPFLEFRGFGIEPVEKEKHEKLEVDEIMWGPRIENPGKKREDV